MSTDVGRTDDKVNYRKVAAVRSISARPPRAFDGRPLYQKLGVEGIVAKRAETPYRRGRTGDWLKIKTPAGKAIDEERAKMEPK